jgi:hypothetical protein
MIECGCGSDRAKDSGDKRGPRRRAVRDRQLFVVVRQSNFVHADNTRGADAVNANSAHFRATRALRFHDL